MLVSLVCTAASQYLHTRPFTCSCSWPSLAIAFKRSSCMLQMLQLVNCEIILGKSNMNTLCCHINSLGEMMCHCPVQFFLSSFACRVVLLCVFSLGKAFFVTPGIPIHSMSCDQELISDVFDPPGLLHNDMNKIVVTF